MCYYDQTIYACGDWRWNHFRKHCQKEYRMGETCGMKLVYHAHQDPNKCTVCISLDKKHRRYAKTRSDYERWIADPTKKASAAKAAEDCQILYKEIEELERDRAARKCAIGSNSSRRKGA